MVMLMVVIGLSYIAVHLKMMKIRAKNNAVRISVISESWG